MSLSLFTLSRCFLFTLLYLSTFCVAASATTRNVPSQYSTIQAAITAAANGDTVLIADGTYTGPGNVDLDFGGKGITVTSQNGPTSTIIDCGGVPNSVNHRGFYLHSHETNAVISGLTIKNGSESGDPNLHLGGGAIYNAGVSVTIQNCIITHNAVYTGLGATGGAGGGIYNENNGTGIITVNNCIISGNGVIPCGGAGMYNLNDSTGKITVTNCTFTDNTTAGAPAGGVFNYNKGSGTIALTNCNFNHNAGNYSAPVGGGGGAFNATDAGSISMTNCTVTGNTSGYGIANYGTVTLINDIIYNNTGGDIYLGSGLTSISYCDFSTVNNGGSYTGINNINADPMFVGALANLHLKATSLCVGFGTASGAPNTTLDGYTRPNPPSIGAYETAPYLTATASGGKVNLTWLAPAGPVTSYTLYRGTVSGGEATRQSMITTTSFQDTAVTPGTTYYYIVKAVNTSGIGPASNEVSVTP